MDMRRPMTDEEKCILRLFIGKKPNHHMDADSIGALAKIPTPGNPIKLLLMRKMLHLHTWDFDGEIAHDYTITPKGENWLVKHA